jgi:ankyrin repeat protein
MLAFTTLENEFTPIGAQADVLALWFLGIAAFQMLLRLSFHSGSTTESLEPTESVGKHESPKCFYSSRLARFMNCEKRAMRRHKNKGHGCCEANNECPIARAFAKLHESFGAPLPFHRRRRCCRTTTDSTVATSSDDESLSAMDLDSFEDSSSELETTESGGTSSMTKALQTPVLDLARMQHWSQILARSPVRRREAKYQDADGLLALHWACSGGPPVDVVKALLQSYPAAARHVDSDGSAPLHFAAHYGGSPSVIHALIHEYPEASSLKDKFGRTALYHAVVKSAGMENLRLLVRANPSMAIEPCVPASGTLVSSSRRVSAIREELSPSQRTPLFIAWFQARKHLRRGGRALNKAELLLRAVYQLDSPARNFLLLHATIEFDAYLPKEIFPYAFEQYPEQVRETDDQGQIPLVVAAQSSSKRAPELISMLLQAFPQGSRVVDQQGRTPLFIAVASGRRWGEGVRELFEAYPQALEMRDRQTGLYPALLSASIIVNRIQEEKVDADLQHQQHLSTIYELLRANPAICRW